MSEKEEYLCPNCAHNQDCMTFVEMIDNGEIMGHTECRDYKLKEDAK